jgi:hypothetical protein
VPGNFIAFRPKSDVGGKNQDFAPLRRFTTTA